MSRPQGSYNASAGPPKYLQEFTKALAGEVRILLEEVGKLRDERSQLQAEIAELMAVKAKHGGGPGGEYAGWISKREPTPPPASPPPAPPTEIIAAKPAWRTVYKKSDRRAKKAITNPAPPPEPTPPPPPPNVPAWAQWRPDPIFSPQPKVGGVPLTTPSTPRAGLFGPSTPPPNM